MTELSRPSEDDLIARHLRPLARHPGAFALADDCAALTPPPGCDLVLKTDAVASGIHFFADDPWDMVARKALRVNVSDLAAKGARPLAWMLTLALPADWREADLARFAAALAEEQETWGLALMGGDTLRAPSGLVISITVFGTVPTGTMLRRAGARVGDELWVSGTLGDAALGLVARLDPAAADAWRLSPTERAHLDRRYLLPEPRLALAPVLAAHAHGAMDLSDGLGLDLARMGRAAGLAAEVDLDRLPLSPAATRVVVADPTRIETVVSGGDDYEILAAVSPISAESFVEDAARAGVAVTRIGRVVAGEPGRIAFATAKGPAPGFVGGGFRHF